MAKQDLFNCEYIFTMKCIDQENKDCDKCPLKSCNNCDNNWSSHVCNQCRFNKD